MADSDKPTDKSTAAPAPLYRALAHLDLQRKGKTVTLTPGVLKPNTLTPDEAAQLIAMGVVEDLTPSAYVEPDA
jgi:hypothetical protein